MTDSPNTTQRSYVPRLRRQRPDPRTWRFEATALVDEIIATGACLSAARDDSGASIRRTDAQWRLLCTLERTSYCLSISDIGRAMRISRQAAHALVSEVATAELIELLTNPDDRCLVQVRLTPLGRSILASWRRGEASWVIALLNGLDTHTIRATTHILYVIRQRLVRNEREQVALSRAQPRPRSSSVDERRSRR
jgi:DNA-binding MarR family transcriptional regulator